MLAVADGYVPSQTPKPIDPAAGAVSFTLKPHDLDKRDPRRVLKGRVVDEEGEPVPNALVEPFGFGTKDGTQFGGLKGFDSLALTDDKGAFRLGVPTPGLLVYVRVKARLHAPGAFSKLPAGAKSHELKLFAGVTVTGRLMKNGKPLVGAAVGAVQKNRAAETFIGEFKAASDDRGVFSLPNMPPRNVLMLYGLMDSLRSQGAVSTREIKTGASGSVLDVGRIDVEAGHKLSGRVVLSDGKSIPAGTRVLLSREEAWDAQQVVLDKEGRFIFIGLPTECYSLSASVRGYHLSAKSASFDLLNQFRILGMVREDIEGLMLLLEPGRQTIPPFDQKNLQEYNRRRQATLRGVAEEK